MNWIIGIGLIVGAFVCWYIYDWYVTEKMNRALRKKMEEERERRRKQPYVEPIWMKHHW